MTGADADGPGRAGGVHARALPRPAQERPGTDDAADVAGRPDLPDLPDVPDVPDVPATLAWLGRWLVPVVPAVAALVTGGYHLGVPPLWRDEAATKAIAGRPVGQIVATMPHDDVVHFAYYLVVHVVIMAAGSSNAALRLPSVLAMAVAAAFTALIARRLTRPAAGLPAERWYAAGAGLAAGLVFAVLPAVIRYAQEARSYAIVTMLAAIATYLLLRALDEGERCLPRAKGRPRRPTASGTTGWWVAYSAAVFLTGLFNIFGLLILAAHGLTVLAAGRAGRARRRLLGGPAGWLIAGAVAAVLLVPLGLMAYAQRDALSWMSPAPIVKNVVALTHLWPGSPTLAWPVFGLAATGVVASLIAERRTLSIATVALPWLVAPPAILLAASTSHPVYDESYVEFCLPALAICVAAGLTWLWRGVAAVVPRAWPAAVPAIVALAAVVGLIAALQPADAAVRQPGYRPDNLEHEAQIIAGNAKPGDIVFFIPVNDRIVSMPFPDPWRKLRDIALAETPAASNTLYGTDVSPPGLLARFTRVTRVWVVSSSEVPLASYLASPQATAVDREEAGLIGRMREVRRWRDGDTELTLYATR